MSDKYVGKEFILKKDSRGLIVERNEYGNNTEELFDVEIIKELLFNVLLCPYCDGKGWVEPIIPVPEQTQVKCHACSGTGKIYWENQKAAE